MEFGPFPVRSDAVTRSDGAGMGEPRRLQPFGCGRSRDCEGFAGGADVWASGVAVGDGRHGTGRSADRGIVGGTQQRHDLRLHGTTSDGDGEVAECSRRAAGCGRSGRDCFGGHAALAGRSSGREIECEGGRHIVDGIAGDAARVRNSGGVPGAFHSECESDCARRTERVGEPESEGAAVVSGAGIERASRAVVSGECARVRATD